MSRVNVQYPPAAMLRPFKLNFYEDKLKVPCITLKAVMGDRQWTDEISIQWSCHPELVQHDVRDYELVLQSESHFRNITALGRGGLLLDASFDRPCSPQVISKPPTKCGVQQPPIRATVHNNASLQKQVAWMSSKPVMKFCFLFWRNQILMVKEKPFKSLSKLSGCPHVTADRSGLIRAPRKTEGLDLSIW